MSLMNGIVNANQALAGEDLHGDTFTILDAKVTLNVSPASPIAITSSGAGMIIEDKPRPERTTSTEFRITEALIKGVKNKVALPSPVNYPNTVNDGNWKIPKEGLWNIAVTMILTKDGLFNWDTGSLDDGCNVFVTIFDADGTRLVYQEYSFRTVQPEGPPTACTFYINTANTVRVSAGASYEFQIRPSAEGYKTLVDYPVTTNLQILYMGA